MQPRLCAVALAAAIATALSATGALAAPMQQAQDPSAIVVSTNSGTPLLLDDIESEKVPTGVAAGTRVCAPGPRVYKSEGERWIFQQWSTGSTDDCIVPSSRGSYRALYSHEVLMLIKSAAPGIQRSMWVGYAAPLQLAVPETVQEGDNTRYRFQGWSDGETPFERTNTIAPVKPTILEVKWAREHRLQVEGPEGTEIKGSGWYAEGTNLVLRAPETIAGDSDQARLKFARWESTSFPAAQLQNPTSPTMTIGVQMPYSVRASYDQQYMVNAASPVGTLKHDWVNSGQEVVLESAPVLDVVPEQERLVFRRWDGIDGLLSPKFSGKVDKPINVTAVYDRQVMLKVNAPYGAAGDGWQKAGSVATVGVPGSVAQMPLLKSNFVGFGGYPAGESSIHVLVNEPTVLTAMYRTEPDWLILAILIGLPLAVGLTFLAYRKGWLAALRARLRRRVRGALRVSVAGQSSNELSTHRNGAQVAQPIGHQEH